MKKIILLIITLFFTGCYAREMILVDPEINFRDLGVKNALFLGFSPNGEKTKLPLKIKTRLNEYLLKGFGKFSGLNVIKAEENDIINFSVKPENLTNLAKKYQADLLILGLINDYKELKYIEQPASNVYQSNTYVPNGSSVNKNIVTFQSGIDASLSFIKPDGKVLWFKKLSEIESSQFEDSSGRITDENDDITAFDTTREKLLENITNQVLGNLLPYYTYK